MGIVTRFIRTSYLHPGEQTMVPVKSLFFFQTQLQIFSASYRVAERSKKKEN